MAFQVEKITKQDKHQVSDILRSFWGDETIVVHDEIFHAAELDGLKATNDNAIVGILHYQLRGDVCEILSLVSLEEGQGIGTALLTQLEALAKKQGCHSVILTTTNDNLNALGFYQRRGFKLAALFPGQVNQSRQLKPTIPFIGENNIPIRDEICLKKAIL